MRKIEAQRTTQNGSGAFLAVLFFISIVQFIAVTLWEDGTFSQMVLQAKLRALNYTVEAETYIKENGLSEEVVAKGMRSDFLQLSIEDRVFDVAYFEDYYEIPKRNNTDYATSVRELLDTGYRPAEINCIYRVLSDENIDLLTQIVYYDKLVNMLVLPYFRETRLHRYILYADENPQFSMEDVVTYVDLDLDKENYYEALAVGDPNSIDVLLTKHRCLPDGFVPQNLITIDEQYNPNGWSLSSEAAMQFEALCAAAEEDGILLRVGSAYRAEADQRSVYDSYLSELGEDAGALRVAVPDFSEHQTGLAVDVWNLSDFAIAEDSEEWWWMQENAMRFGFVQRYEPGKEYITGYQAESWHYRYLGVALATEVSRSGLTVDEWLIRQNPDR
ncbi:MAG: M15 family metallopeptidase [Clostridiales Family XIII bacterium]|jgi:D-alanyl-D-alanine carboxypeptidase|nr:M15 family metallopeptidase [Clostridiales Family XIII bacterium]